jgi:hypothetical protein
MDQEKSDNYVPVELCTKSQLMRGHVFCPVNSRVSDLINDVYVSARNAKGEFLEFAPTSDSTGRETYEQIPKEYIRKAAIELLALSDADLRRGIGGSDGPKVYPYKQKNQVPVRLEFNVHLNTYSLEGSIHCGQGQATENVLCDDRSFLLLTDVMMPREFSICGTKPFVALNKEQIISCQYKPTADVNRNMEAMYHDMLKQLIE